MMGTECEEGEEDLTLQIQLLHRKISVLEDKQRISTAVIQEFQKRVAILSSESLCHKDSLKQSLLNYKKEVEELNMDLLTERTKTASLQQDVHAQQAQLQNLQETNIDLSHRLEVEKKRYLELSLDFETHVKLTCDIGNKQLGQLKTKSQMIHSLESDVILTFKKPLKLLWNLMFEKDILKLNQRNWVPDSVCNQCQDLSCGKSFGLLCRKHHCRRCGHLYCSDHLVKVKISILEKVADPEGIDTKICKSCYPLIHVFAANLASNTHVWFF
jgi:hypothetical protein